MSGAVRSFARGNRWRALRSRRSPPAFKHSMQVRRCVLDVMVLVLAGAAFRGQQTTEVDTCQTPRGKFFVALGLLMFLFVDSQIPLAVFGKTVKANEFIFLRCGWPVL